MDRLIQIMAQLRSPQGCPWDIAQDHNSIKKNLLEETYEVLEAIDLNDSENLCEELGDLLLQVVFHAQIAKEGDSFTINDVIDGICEKLIRRHPHVFGEAEANNSEEALKSWESVKTIEKNSKVTADNINRISAMDGIVKQLPALLQAEKIQKKASKIGFDWSDYSGPREKINEELSELDQAIKNQDVKKIREELGDLLFSVVNLSRFFDVDAEDALRLSNNKFVCRFQDMEQQIKDKNLDINELDLAEMDKLWDNSKIAETKKEKINNIL